MANSRHYKWQALWSVEGAVARHESGFTVTITGRVDAPPGVLDALAQKHGPHNAPQVQQRLVREGLACLAAAQAGVPLRHAKL